MGYRDYHTGINGTCYGCPDRTIEPNCHTTCEKYIKAKDTWENHKNMIKAAKEKEGIYTHYKHDKIRREIRKGAEHGKHY